jgi:hypothetical protein
MSVGISSLVRGCKTLSSRERERLVLFCVLVLDLCPLAGLRRIVEYISPRPQSRTFTPDNKPEKNEWYWQDVPTMASLTGSLPVLIDATAGVWRLHAVPHASSEQLGEPSQARFVFNAREHAVKN